MKIKFHEIEYSLLDIPNATYDHFQATIFKDEYSLDDIFDDIQGIERIEVTDGDEVVRIYTSYSTFIALSTYYLDPETRIISIELSNDNIQNQINRQGEEIAELIDSQETQDLAIEDLAEAVSDLTPEE